MKAIMSKMNLIRLQILGQGQMHCIFQNLKFERFNGDHVHHRTRAFLLVVENELKPWLKRSLSIRNIVIDVSFEIYLNGLAFHI